ncbi:MAG: polysaccharide deacetylase family protein [Heyndrickxia sp.]
MNQASQYRKMKLLAKIIIGVLVTSVVFLLFYNSKITKGEPALAKNTSTTISTPNQTSPTYHHMSQDLFIHHFVFNEKVKNESILQQELLKEMEEYPIKIAISQPTKNETKKIINGPSTKDKEEKKAIVQTDSKKQVYIKSPSTKAQKVVYLTFDDGPSTSSAKTLQLLKKYHAKATFFMLEPNIKKYQSIVKQMVKDGNSVGSHGVTHDIHKIYRSPNSFVKEMNQTSQTLKNITGVNSQLIRVPYGSVPYMKPAFRKASGAEGFIMWDWDIDSDDWQTTHGEFVQKIKNQVENCSGTRPVVVLMHEKTTTVKYLEQVLQYFQQKGYKMEAISPNLKPVQFKYR